MWWKSYPVLHCSIYWYLGIILLNVWRRQAKKFCAFGKVMLCKSSLYIILNSVHTDSKCWVNFITRRVRMADSWMAFLNDPSLICSPRAWPTSCCYLSFFSLNDYLSVHGTFPSRTYPSGCLVSIKYFCLLVLIFQLSRADTSQILLKTS